jgi:hypothetical protein
MLVLELGLDAVDRVRGLDLERDRMAGEHPDEDLCIVATNVTRSVACCGIPAQVGVGSSFPSSVMPKQPFVATLLWQLVANEYRQVLFREMLHDCDGERRDLGRSRRRGRGSTVAVLYNDVDREPLGAVSARTSGVVAVVDHILGQHLWAGGE